MKRISSKILVASLGSGTAIGLLLGGFFMAMFTGSADIQPGRLDKVLRNNFDRGARIEVETVVSLLGAVEKLS